MPDSVYFLETDNAWKIGFSTMPSKRLASYRTTMPNKIISEKFVRASRAQERWAHKLLAAHCIRGEWFAKTGEVRSFVDRAMQGDWSGYQEPDNSNVVDARTDAQKQCERFADFIRKCAALCDMDDTPSFTQRVINGPDRLGSFWTVSTGTIYKFCYRAKEPKIQEFMRLLHGVHVAAEAAKKLIDDEVAFATTIINEHAERLEQVRRAGEALAELEAALSASPLVAESEALVSEDDEAA
jgi:hypothetical protein